MEAFSERVQLELQQQLPQGHEPNRLGDALLARDRVLRLWRKGGGGGSDSIGMGGEAWDHTGTGSIWFYNYNTRVWDVIASSWLPARQWNWYRWPAATNSPYKDPTGWHGGIAFVCGSTSDTFKIAYVDFWYRPNGGSWTYNRKYGKDYTSISANYRIEGNTLVMWGYYGGYPSQALYFGDFLTGVEEPAERMPVGTTKQTLHCCPNPMSERGEVRFNAERNGYSCLDILDEAGRTVRTLVSGTMSAGSHMVTWNRTGKDGKRLPAGVYFCRLKAEDFTETVKVVITD